MIESQDGRRVVVTGLGVVSSCGIGIDEFWRGLSRPVDEPATMRRVADFDPATWGMSSVEGRRLDRYIQFAISAAGQALVDAALLSDPAAAGAVSGVDPARVAVLIGNGATIPAASVAVLTRWDLRGPCDTVSTSCATGTHAIGRAARWVVSGRADVALAGGSQALSSTNVAAYTSALSSVGISRPFDLERDGLCLAEGAAVLVLEEATHAAARGARVYAELAGAGANAEAYYPRSSAPAGRQVLACMRAALADAHVSAADVTYINAHGTSTLVNDATEAQAVRELFRAPGPAVTAIKGATGHALSGAGAIEAVSVALSYAHGSLPPTMGTRKVDPAFKIDVVLEPRPWQPAAAISNSFGFDGHNGSLVFVPA